MVSGEWWRGERRAVSGERRAASGGRRYLVTPGHKQSVDQVSSGLLAREGHDHGGHAADGEEGRESNAQLQREQVY